MIRPPRPLPCAANWAQVSGTKLQNVATQSTPGWTNRWGHAMTSYHQGGSDILVVLGGDSYFADIGSGILMNDVWISLNLCKDWGG